MLNQKQLCSLDLRCSRRLRFDKTSNFHKPRSSLFPPPQHKRSSEHFNLQITHNSAKARLRSRQHKRLESIPTSHTLSWFREGDLTISGSEPKHQTQFQHFERPERPERPELPELPERPERPERLERGDIYFSTMPPLSLPISLYQVQTQEIAAYLK